ncbi:MAG: hypothetical protein HDKAJFGB_02841 [Anaerolineae bacterium]|nr:hypothetical protein [Anaerolineae bacterium]
MVYRGRNRIRTPWLVGIAIVIVASIALIGVWLVLRSNSVPDDPRAAARAKALEAAQGLEVFTIEYPQADQGAELTGAREALARAQKAFEAAQSELGQIDATAVEQIAAAFAALKEKTDARAPVEKVMPLADELREKLLILAAARP